MIFIAFLFPAVLSMNIWLNRMGKNDNIPLILEYMKWTLINVFLSMITVVFVLGLSGADSSAFDSFSFFIKYLVIAIVYAAVAPFVIEILKKWIGIEVRIETNEKA